MKTMMKSSLKLLLICSVAAAALGGVNAVTAPLIEKIRIERLQQALAEVMPGEELKPAVLVEDNPTVDSRFDVEGDSSRYVLRLVGQGYGGDMFILAAYKSDGTVLEVKMMENLETPGLGKEAEKPQYMEKFTGKTGKFIPVRKGQLSAEQADTVSGATITFIGVGKALKSGSEYIRSIQ